MKLENAIEFVVNTKTEQADKSLKDFNNNSKNIRSVVGDIVTKQTYFGSKRLILNKPSSVKSYIETGLLMKLNEETFTAEEKIKFAELQLRHSNLFNFIELVKEGKTELDEDFEKILDFCPEGKEVRRLKQRAYDFLGEKDIAESTSKSYFTRSSYTNKILDGIDIPQHQLVQILLDYQKYINNSEWRKYIKEKRKEQEDRERKKNVKKTFTQWLSTKTL